MKYTLLLVTATMFLSCMDGEHEQPEETKFDIAPVKKHIFEMNKKYAERFTSNDSAFYADRYCIDAQVMSPNVETVKGRAAIQKFFYNDGQSKETVIELPDGNVYGNAELVVEESSYNFPDGKGGSFDKGKFIAIWKQEDGKWKLYREIWNTDNPLAPPPPAQ